MTLDPVGRGVQHDERVRRVILVALRQSVLLCLSIRLVSHLDRLRLGWSSMTLSSEWSLALDTDQRTDVPQPTRPSIAIIGLGRVGMVLGRALHAAGYKVVAVASRSPVKAASAAVLFKAVAAAPLAATQAADLTLLTISDDAIPAVVAELAATGAWQAGQSVVHASGASPGAVLASAAVHGAAIGGLHPLAAFANPDATLPPGLTFAIEATGVLHGQLWRMAQELGGYPLDLDPAHKTLYHAAAVIASNYTVTLAALATELFAQMGTSPAQALQALVPLMRTTLDNMERQGLPLALTGPLLRGDVSTVHRHLVALDEAAPRVGALYRCLAHGTLPLAQQRGLPADMAGALRDMITLPGELLAEREAL